MGVFEQKSRQVRRSILIGAAIGLLLCAPLIVALYNTMVMRMVISALSH